MAMSSLGSSSRAAKTGGNWKNKIRVLVKDEKPFEIEVKFENMLDVLKEHVNGAASVEEIEICTLPIERPVSDAIVNGVTQGHEYYTFYKLSQQPDVTFDVYLNNLLQVVRVLVEKLLVHVFLVFKTSDSKWWSVEKHTDVITLQRADQKSEVTDTFRGEERKLLKGLRKRTLCDHRGKTIEQFLEFLSGKDCKHTIPYHFIHSNCIQFAVEAAKWLMQSLE